MAVSMDRCRGMIAGRCRRETGDGRRETVGLKLKLETSADPQNVTTSKFGVTSQQTMDSRSMDE